METAVVRLSMPGGVGGQRREPLPTRLTMGKPTKEAQPMAGRPFYGATQEGLNRGRDLGTERLRDLVTEGHRDRTFSFVL